MVVRVNLRNKTANGRHNKIFFSNAAQLPVPPKPVSETQTGQGFKALDDKISKLSIDTNKKMNKFISFKL